MTTVVSEIASMKSETKRAIVKILGEKKQVDLYEIVTSLDRQELEPRLRAFTDLCLNELVRDGYLIRKELLASDTFQFTLNPEKAYSVQSQGAARRVTLQ